MTKKYNVLLKLEIEAESEHEAKILSLQRRNEARLLRIKKLSDEEEIAPIKDLKMNLLENRELFLDVEGIDESLFENAIWDEAKLCYLNKKSLDRVFIVPLDNKNFDLVVLIPENSDQIEVIKARQEKEKKRGIKLVGAILQKLIGKSMSQGKKGGKKV